MDLSSKFISIKWFDVQKTFKFRINTKDLYILSLIWYWYCLSFFKLTFGIQHLEGLDLLYRQYQIMLSLPNLKWKVFLIQFWVPNQGWASDQIVSLGWKCPKNLLLIGHLANLLSFGLMTRAHCAKNVQNMKICWTSIWSYTAMKQQFHHKWSTLLFILKPA